MLYYSIPVIAMSKRIVIAVGLVILLMIPSMIASNTSGKLFGEYYGTEPQMRVLYHLNNNTGDTICLDEATADGTQNGIFSSIDFEPGKFGNCAVFDGDGYINVGDSDAIDLIRGNTYPNNLFSLEFWVYVTDYTTTNQYVIYKRGAYSIYIENDHIHMSFTYIDSGGTSYNVDVYTTFYRNRWDKYAFTYDNSYFRLYRNTYMARYVYAPDSHIKTTNHDLIIGARQKLSGDYTEFLVGKIDEVSIISGKSYDIRRITDIKLMPVQTPLYVNNTATFMVYGYNVFNRPHGLIDCGISIYNSTSGQYDTLYQTSVWIDDNYNTISYFFTQNGKYKICGCLSDTYGIYDEYTFDVVEPTNGSERGIILAPQSVYANTTFEVQFFLQNKPFSTGESQLDVISPTGQTIMSEDEILQYYDSDTVYSNHSISLPYAKNTDNIYTLRFTIYEIGNGTPFGIWQQFVYVMFNQYEQEEYPMSSFVLKLGWNLISIPDKDGIMASELFEMNQNITVIETYLNGNYIAIHRNHTDSVDIKINSNIGFYVYVNKPTVLDMILSDANFFTQIPVNKGWNLIGVPYQYVTTPDEIVRKNPHIKYITVRKDDKYYTYIANFTHDFPYPIETGDGIFVYSESDQEVVW